MYLETIFWFTYKYLLHPLWCLIDLSSLPWSKKGNLDFHEISMLHLTKEYHLLSHLANQKLEVVLDSPPHSLISAFHTPVPSPSICLFSQQNISLIFYQPTDTTFLQGPCISFLDHCNCLLTSLPASVLVFSKSVLQRATRETGWKLELHLVLCL